MVVEFVDVSALVVGYIVVSISAVVSSYNVVLERSLVGYVDFSVSVVGYAVSALVDV